MKKTKRSHKIIAIFLTLNFLSTIVPTNLLFANNNGPKAPEAGSFEPVDATDMVNLLTGDFTYVLPLLNVPSPEGGYPVSLAYHAGIAMDQEASWTGLGWNLNPGAINRSVNGFPDDYNNAKIYEHFYDHGSETSYTAGLSYSDPSGTASIGLDFSWGTNKSFGGSVSFGVGIPILNKVGKATGASIGINGSIGEKNSIGVGYTSKGGLSFGASVSDSGGFGGSFGFDNNSSGFSVSANSSGSVGFGVSGSGKNGSLGLNFNISQSGVGISGTVKKKEGGKVVGGLGTSINLSFANTIEQGDYAIKQSGFTIPIVVPTPVGIFGAHFGKQKIDWFLNNTVENRIYGFVNPQGTIDTNTYCLDCEYYTKIYNCLDEYGQDCSYSSESSVNGPPQICLLNYNEALAMSGIKLLSTNIIPYNNGYQKIESYRHCKFENTNTDIEAMMDVYEFPLDQIAFTHLDKNNAIFPNNDKFTVDAQGISGNMSVKPFENGSLFGLVKKHSSFDIKYGLDGSGVNSTSALRFDSKAQFYFENEFSTYLATNPATFNKTNTTFGDILEYHNFSNPDALPRRKVSKFIEYFTNAEIHGNDNSKYVRGYLKPKSFSQLSNPDPNGIGAFTIVGSDGKKYHYSIPVYNHVISTRNIGGIKNNGGEGKPEQDAYFERLQDTPYATHWLLTAVTGPDYIDTNNNHLVDENDYGYWVEFDYGKWSDAYVWKTPYGKEYLESKNDDDFKSTTYGFKEVYYLDAIKTRTHTALFVKSTRRDNMSSTWRYKSVDWKQGTQNSSDFVERFTIPSQRSLKLNNIVLLKNEAIQGFSKSSGDMPIVSRGSESIKFTRENAVSKTYYFNLEDNVYDLSDIPENIYENATKVIHLGYKKSLESLAQNTPNTIEDGIGRLTLDKVQFNGKDNASIMPPYNFKYYNEKFYNIDKKNAWGYYENEPWQWSLKEIQTPEGGKIQVTYESDDYEKPVLQNGRLFTHGLEFVFQNYQELQNASDGYNGDPDDAPEIPIQFRINFNQDNMNDIKRLREFFNESKPFYMDLWFSAVDNYNGNGYKRSSIDIKQNQASIVDLVDIGDYIGNVGGTDVVSNEAYMIVQVSASIPSSRETYLQDDASPVSNSHAGPPNEFPWQQPYKFGQKNQKRSRYDLAWKEDGDGKGYSLQYSIVGNRDLFNQTDGDLRVKQLTTTDGVESYTTNYLYNQVGYSSDPSNSNYKSSGTVSYIPHEDNNPIPYSTELPAPKVMYEYVTVQGGESQQTTRYHFNVMKEKNPDNLKFGDFLEIEKTESEIQNSNGRKVQFAEITIHDNLASIGQVLEISSFNKEGQLLSKSENEYFSSSNRLNNQGIDQQSYQTYKEIDYKENLQRQDKWLVNSSTRRNYAQALKSTKSTFGGYSYNTNFTKYDPITGSTLETQITTSKGQRVKNVVVPAYTKYPQMGSKTDNINNKNMLAQEAANYTFINKKATWQPIGVGITTWDNNWTYKNKDGTNNTPTNQNHKIWRKHKSYIWDGETNENGTYIGYDSSPTNDDGFNWTTGNGPRPWKKISETTLYDHYSMPLEVKDINNNYAATKMWYKDTKVASTGNAKYTEHFSSNAEAIESAYIGNGVLLENSTKSEEKSHTGMSSVKIGASQKAFRTILKTGEHRSGQYRISVWTHKDTYENIRVRYNNGSLKPFNGEVIKAGNWVQLNHTLGFLQNRQEEVYITSTTGNTFLDDYRLYPVASSVTSYVYNTYDELEATLGSNNLATKYQYDKAGRLIRVYQEVADTPTIIGGFKRAGEYRYNYVRSINSTTGDAGGDNEGEVYFTNILTNNGSNPSTGKLVGTPGLEVTFEARCESTEGSGSITFNYNGQNDTEYLNFGETSTFTRTIPSNGEINVSIEHFAAVGQQYDSSAIGTILTILSTVPDAYIHDENSFRDMNTDR